MECLPPSLKDKVYYEPTEMGSESRVKERMKQIQMWKKQHR